MREPPLLSSNKTEDEMGDPQNPTCMPHTSTPLPRVIAYVTRWFNYVLCFSLPRCLASLKEGLNGLLSFPSLLFDFEVAGRLQHQHTTPDLICMSHHTQFTARGQRQQDPASVLMLTLIVLSPFISHSHSHSPIYTHPHTPQQHLEVSKNKKKQRPAFLPLFHSSS